MTILMKKSLFEKEKPLNGKCANRTLSQQKGSPPTTVPKFVPTPCTAPFRTVATAERERSGKSLQCNSIEQYWASLGNHTQSR